MKNADIPENLKNKTAKLKKEVQILINRYLDFYNKQLRGVSK